MNNINETNGEKIRSLFMKSSGEVTIIAPYIKFEALESLLEVISNDSRVTCVTSWHPVDVASGHSDPEIIELLESRGNYSAYLVDNLHAKIYVAGTDCLVGSSNVTLAGFGESPNSNIEILIPANSNSIEVTTVLAQIKLNSKPATLEVAKSVRRIANSINIDKLSPFSNFIWLPRSRQPERSYSFYSAPPAGFLSEVDRILLQDIATANLQPGLSIGEFKERINLLLLNFPLTNLIIDDTTDRIISFEDSHMHFQEYAEDGFSSEDLWLAFVKWIVYFFPDEVMEKEIIKIALRRAKKLI